MSSNKQLTKNNQLNLISCYGGNILKEFDDQYIMILVERGPNSFLYEVGIHNNDWFHLRTHELYGHY